MFFDPVQAVRPPAHRTCRCRTSWISKINALAH